MKERPILFSAPIVRALLDGSKTQTRRAIKPQPIGQYTDDGEDWYVQWKKYTTDSAEDLDFACPYGLEGDQLWVRETHADSTGGNGTVFRADMTQLPNQRDQEAHFFFAQHCKIPEAAFKWKPSIFMPRAISRIQLEITGIRVERLQDISQDDAVAEGCKGGHGAMPDYAYNASPDEHFMMLWESINGAGSWNANPWVWVIEFKRVKP